MPPASSTPSVLSQRLFTLFNEAHTEYFAQRLAQALRAWHAQSEPSQPGLQLHLIGTLGAGKTTLTRAVLRAFGHTGRVRSPTYTLVEPYTLALAGKPLNLYHFDLYRFADPEEWIEAGFRDYLNEHALCLIEWPQQAGTLLGVPDLALTLEIIPEGRRLIVQAFTDIGKMCVDPC